MNAAQKRERLLLAVHESGHVIARLSLTDGLGSPIEFVTLDEPHEQCDAFVRWQPHWIAAHANATCAPKDRAAIRAFLERAAHLDVLESLAGPIAEICFRFDRDKPLPGQFQFVREPASAASLDLIEICLPMPDNYPEGHDYRIATERAEWVFPDDYDAQESYLTRAWEEALALVERERDLIAAFAKLLTKRGRIEGDEIYAWWDSVRGP